MTRVLPVLPESIASLPRDDRGYPIPWFVKYINGVPDFRVVDAPKWAIAVKERRCWVCGERIADDRAFAFVTGPMCTISRTSAEPPSHRECAEFSPKVCPFLSIPTAKRREANLPEHRNMGGIAILRNPACTAVWLCESYEVFTDHNDQPLIRMGEPFSVSWFCQGREALRSEVEASIDSGLPILMDMADQDGPGAMAALCESVNDARRFLPPKGVEE